MERWSLTGFEALSKGKFGDGGWLILWGDVIGFSMKRNTSVGKRQTMISGSTFFRSGKETSSIGNG